MIVADHEYHVVELEYANVDCIEWCSEKFGEAVLGRWFRKGSKIYFLNAQDHLMFLLRWA
jgi:hypothetical protein